MTTALLCVWVPKRFIKKILYFVSWFENNANLETQNTQPMESIVIDPDIMSGTPVFKGTRVPITTMLDYLASGASTMQDFLEDYPSVSAADAKSVLSGLGNQLLNRELMKA